jgi:hypothetical protein
MLRDFCLDTLDIEAPTADKNRTVVRRLQQVFELRGKHSVYIYDTWQTSSSDSQDAVPKMLIAAAGGRVCCVRECLWRLATPGVSLRRDGRYTIALSWALVVRTELSLTQPLV